MSGKYILRNGEPVPCEDVLEWARWFETANEERKIGWTVHGDVTVSTMFLGLDHSFGIGEPLLYETMIFGGPHNEEMWRYPTKAEAIEGHKRAVELALSAQATEPQR
jgi:hypothetical protein